MEEHKKKISTVLEEIVHCNKSFLFILRGQVWEQVIKPIIMMVLIRYWTRQAADGKSIYEAAKNCNRVGSVKFYNNSLNLRSFTGVRDMQS